MQQLPFHSTDLTVLYQLLTFKIYYFGMQYSQYNYTPTKPLTTFFTANYNKHNHTLQGCKHCNTNLITEPGCLLCYPQNKGWKIVILLNLRFDDNLVTLHIRSVTIMIMSDFLPYFIS